MVLNFPFTKTLYIDLPHYRFEAVSQSYLRGCLPGYSPHFALILFGVILKCSKKAKVFRNYHWYLCSPIYKMLI